MKLYTFKAFPRNGGEPVKFLAPTYRIAYQRYCRADFNVVRY